MGGFRYRLALLLDRKEVARKEAENEAARREQELTAQQKRLEELEQRERELTAERETLRRMPLPPSVVEALERADRVKALAGDIEAAKDDTFAQRIVIEDHERAVAEARTRVAGAKREVEVLVKHRERQEQRYRREESAREEAELDEIGNVLYTTRRSST